MICEFVLIEMCVDGREVMIAELHATSISNSVSSQQFSVFMRFPSARFSLPPTTSSMVTRTHSLPCGFLW